MPHLTGVNGTHVAAFNRAPTSGDAIEKLLEDFQSLDLDAGPARAAIRAHGSGGLFVKDITTELADAQIRLAIAGYTTRFEGGRVRTLKLLVEYK